MRMRKIFTNKETSMTLKLRLLQCYIEPILLYACETWTMHHAIEKRLEAMEMWFLRRMMRVSWTERKSNVDVLKDAECVRTLINKIKKKQARFVGHVMRRNGLENLITTGKFDGRRTSTG